QMSEAVDAVHWLPDVDNNGGCELLAGTRDGYVTCFSAGAIATPNVAITMTPLNPPIQIPSTGGDFDFNIAVENLESSATIVDAWIMVTLPNGSQFGPLLGPVNLTIPGSTLIDRDRNQAVPANAPVGSYTYTGYVGQYPNVIWDEESFPFEKLAGGDGSVGSLEDWVNSGEPFDEIAGFGESDLPLEFALLGNYPNPFNPVTAISYQLSSVSHVNLTVYDVSGRKVAELTDGFRDAGRHEVTFEASGLASGIYLYRLQTSGSGTIPTTVTGKIVLMK
ncbi:MAG: T9SS type A sorting domain-containing protein, partial [bacterium]